MIHYGRDLSELPFAVNYPFPDLRAVVAQFPGFPIIFQCSVMKYRVDRKEDRVRITPKRMKFYLHPEPPSLRKWKSILVVAPAASPNFADE